MWTGSLGGMVQIGANPVGDRIFHDEFVVMPHQFHGIIWIVHGPSEGATRRVAPTLSSQPCGPRCGSTGEDEGTKNNRPGFSTMLWIMGRLFSEK